MNRFERWLPRMGAAAVLAASALTASTGSAEPAAAPKPTTSHYMVLTDDQAGYRTGCADGQQNVTGLRVLFFGTQEAGGKIRPPGTTAASPTARVDEAAVRRAAAGWIQGFTTCGRANAVLALGVNNKSDGGIGGADAGRAWARVVEQVSAAAPADRVTVAAGMDAEPAWSGPDWARGWADGYVASSSRALVTAGSADGCPDGPADPANRCQNGWVVGDVHHVATGAGSAVYALPQVYRTDGIQARQWAWVSRWGVQAGKGPLRVAGALSQQAACRQKSGCSNTDNPPSAAREQLADALAGDPTTRVAFPLSVTDVAWADDDSPDPD